MEEAALVLRRRIRASPRRLFRAWTDPALLAAWWGPPQVRCIRAEIDARVGGLYRIDNEMPDGSLITISGEFVAVVPDERLVFTWRTTPGVPMDEQVTIRFEPQGEHTEVVVIHERIVDEEARRTHAMGWGGCLDGLERFSQTNPGQ